MTVNLLMLSPYAAKGAVNTVKWFGTKIPDINNTRMIYDLSKSTGKNSGRVVSTKKPPTKGKIAPKGEAVSLYVKFNIGTFNLLSRPSMDV